MTYSGGACPALIIPVGQTFDAIQGIVMKPNRTSNQWETPAVVVRVFCYQSQNTQISRKTLFRASAVELDHLDSCQAAYRRCKVEVRQQFSLTEIRQAASARIAAIQTAAKNILEGRQSATSGQLRLPSSLVFSFGRFSVR